MIAPTGIHTGLYALPLSTQTATSSKGVDVLILGATVVLLAAMVYYWRSFHQSAEPVPSHPSSIKHKKRAEKGKQGQPDITFADVAGNEAAKSQLLDLVDFLKRPNAYAAYGAKLPKGILLTGGPGVGKTLLAKAVAGEAGVPVLLRSGSDFVEKYVGVGASRVRELFAQARKKAPCLIFIDEFDALARRRDGDLHEEAARTLNQFLVEMDGFDASQGVVVIAATNFAEALDAAAIRPGRFDRHIDILPPDLEARKAILRVHAQGKPLDGQVDLDALARRTAGLSGAHLANLLNEAAIMGAQEETTTITQVHLNEALIRVIAGLKHPREFEEIKRRIAAHEAGHATVALTLGWSFEHISIEARGKSLGHVFYSEGRDVPLKTKSELERELQILLGGLVAEEMVFGEHSTGPANDLERANEIAQGMIAKYGMNGGLATAKKAERAEVEALLGKWHETVKAILATHREFHQWLTESVLEEGVIGGDAIKAKFAGRD